MRLETQDCRQIAQTLSLLRESRLFSNPSLNERHEWIQEKLADLEAFFLRLAEMAERNEETLSSFKGLSLLEPGMKTGGYVRTDVQGNAGRLFAGKTVSGTLQAGYALAACQRSWKSSLLSAELKGSVMEGTARGSASLRLMKNRTLNPQLNVSLQAQAHAAAASIETELGNSMVSLSARAIGEAGAVYGQAKAVLSVDEQVLSAQIGAAAARGECTLAFRAAGLKITVGLSGSLGSVEAGFDYASRAGSWRIGLKGALFAGAGVRIQIDY